MLKHIISLHWVIELELKVEFKLLNELKNQFGIRTIQQAISGEREEIMQELERKAQLLGIELVDVRINRIELPGDVSESVYQRMRAREVEQQKTLEQEEKKEKISGRKLTKKEQ